MFKFTHVTRFTTKGSDGKDVENKVSEELAVPESIDELIGLAKSGEGQDASTEIMVGMGSDGKEKRITVPLICADYIRGRKLRSNQEQQAANKDGGKVAKRAAAAAWYGAQGQDKLLDLFQRMSAANTPVALKAHNEWLDKLYDDNAASIK